jgi:hypothetical protein
LLTAEANIPFVLPGFQSAAIGLFGLQLAASGLHRRIGAQDARDDFGGWQIGRRFGGNDSTTQAGEQA